MCEACHADVSEKPEKGSVHAALEGSRRRAACLTCHDPHLSENPKLLLAAGPALCGRCHESVVKGAQAETGHAPAGEDCLACHRPHSAAAPKLLTQPAKALCLECHDADDEDLTKAHLGASLGGLECTSCHTPHGVGRKKLLARHLHAPLEDGCDVCHEGAADQLMEDGESSLCLVCHEDVGEQAGAAPVAHGAMDIARCADCHNPHASSQPHLVKYPGGEVCVTCHEDQDATPEETSHAAIERFGCGACHEPHGGTRPKLLRQEGNELCLGCHDARKLRSKKPVRLAERYEVDASVAASMAAVLLTADGTRGHPVPRHPVLGAVTKKAPAGHGRRVQKLTFEGELSCLSCHDPHKGRSPKLLRQAATTAEACLRCHPK